MSGHELEARILKIANLRAKGKDSEADAMMEQLKKDYPRAGDPAAEQTMAMIVKHIKGLA